jgi:hypothetical protein
MNMKIYKPVSMLTHSLINAIFILLIACGNSGKQMAVTSRMELLSVSAIWTNETCFINDTCGIELSIINNSQTYVQVEAKYIILRHAKKNDEIFGDDRSLRYVSPKKEPIILAPNKQTELIIDIIASSDFFESGTNNVWVFVIFTSANKRYMAVSDEIEIFIADL